MHEPPTVLQADKEHGGIQFAIPLVMLAAGLLSYSAIDALILAPLLAGGDWDSFRPFLRLVLSIVLGIAAGGVAEAVLKSRWGSGRALQIDSIALTAINRGDAPQRLEWGQRINLLRWRYALRGYPRGGRERRIPSGHLLLACRLVQDDRSVVAHCYLPPKRAEQVPGYNRFDPLEMDRLYGSGGLKLLTRPERPSIPPALLSGQDGQLWLAEKERWAAGFELEPDDFVALLEALEQYVQTPAP